ncbi:AI-2E family transporter [Pseudoflavitalea sp. X16]|uniref:AI-2E family transporter n=1 Tax=Paraflavitalea devenefica TaxID=2716334 RepID=UPI0014233F6C|nr:AI-2E family transporter [Paraflavitalea devenefica]NII27824.1 AI-2E family transporter [Paraflavitalea devenefica]
MDTYRLTSRSFGKLLQVTVFLLVILYFGRTLFIPMCYGLLIAIVLYPICRWLEQKGWPRSLAITAGLLIVAILFAALLTLLVIQLQVFWKDFPALLAKLKPALLQLQAWITSFGISTPAQHQWWQQTLQQAGSNMGSFIKGALSAGMGGIVILFLVPVYTALFLYNRRVFVQFLSRLAGTEYREQLQHVLKEVIHTYFNFIKGMVMVYIIVGILNSIGLLALGIPHALLFGMLTAIMTIIPYVGIFISALLPISVAWITRDSIWYPMGVVAVFGFVQYLEANVIFPRVVAAQLKVSTWATLVAIIAGGILWGVSGMILFIPFTGILKIISDHLPATFLGHLNVLLDRSPKK